MRMNMPRLPGDWACYVVVTSVALYRLMRAAQHFADIIHEDARYTGE